MEVRQVKGKNKRRFNKFVSMGLIITLAVSFCVGVMQSPVINDVVLSSFAAEASKEHSTEEINFEFNEKGNILTLSGSIEMPDYTEQEAAPWGEFRKSAQKIVISDGIKSVGDNAFVSFSDLNEVTIPQSVTEISDKAFVDCKEGFIIKGIKDSEANTFAAKNEYKFEELGAVSASDTSVAVNPEDTTTTAPTTTTTVATTTTTTTAAPADPTIPTNVTVTCTAYNKLKISWNKVEGAAGYYVYCATSKNGKYTVAKYVNSGNTTSFVHSSRAYEKVYYYKISSYKIVNRKKVFSPYSQIVSGKTHVDPPSAVSNVRVKCTAYNKLTISWDKVDNAAGYYVYCATSKNGKYSLAKNITKNSTTSFVHSSRVYEKTYYYKVRSYTKAGSKAIFADYSETVSGKTHVDPPAAVQNVKVTCKSYNQLTISWNKVDKAAGYYVYWSTSENGKYNLARNISRNTTTSFVHSGRNLGQTYYYKVVSYTKAGYKAIVANASEIVSGKTYLHVPSAPKVTAKADGTMYITITRVTGAQKYNLYRSTDGENYTRIATTSSSSYTDKTSVPGKTYYYKLAAVRGKVTTAASSATTQKCTFKTPTISSASSSSYNSVTIKWKKVSSASEYKIYMSTDPNSDYTCIKTVNSRTYTFTANSLTTGTKYYFRVMAGKSVSGTVGYSSMSSYASAVPTLKSVTKISGSAVGKSAVFVEWTNVAGANGYELYGAVSGKSMTLLTDCKTYYYSHKNLTAGNKYTYKVRAYKMINGKKVYSNFSKTITVTVSKSLSKSTYSWSYSYNVNNHKTPEALIKAQEKASNIKTLFVGDTTRKVIYLTMDCGYPSPNSDKNLNTLKQKNVKATFFIALPYAKGSTKQIQRMIDEGHIVGNHTKNHIRLNRASASTIKSEVKAVEDYIYKNFNYQTKYFRYPYGSFSLASQNELINMGYTSAGWSFAYNDFSKKQPDKKFAFNLVTKNIHPGAIFLLHMDSDTNTAILGDFIDKARELGYEFETLDDIEI